MQLLTPLGLLGALLAIPIILLYMLRLRRREVVIPSTLLWQQVVRDREANTPWQRLRRNLLLFLQLAILAALVLALARPFQIVPTVGAGRIAILLDASASMNATDSADGSRFDEARRIAHQIVDERAAGDVITLLRVGDAPEVLIPYSADSAQLHDAIDAALPGFGSADWNAALTLAAAGGGGAADLDVLILSDGGGVLRGDAAQSGGAALTLPAIPGDLRYIPVGRDDANLAITALAVAALPGEAPQLFAQFVNNGSADADVVIDLRVDDRLVAAFNATLLAGTPYTWTRENLPESFTTLRVGLTLPAGSGEVDHLAVDNAAWAVSSGQGARRALLMTDGNLFLEQGLRSLPGVSVSLGDPARGLPADAYDLYVFDNFVPEALPEGDLLFINPPASTALFAVGAVSTQTSGARVRRDDPRMTFVDFSGVNILQFRQVTADWAEPLITVTGGPLLLAGEVNERQVAILTFDLRDSDLPLQIQYPILLSALIEWFTPQRLVSAGESVRVQSPVTIIPGAAADRVQVIAPDGRTRDYTPTGMPLIYADTAAPGVYRVESFSGAAPDQTADFVVNLFAPEESAIAPAAAITVGNAEITQAVEVEVGQREYWDVLALAALLLLLIEWVAYHRRLRAPTLGATVMRRAARSA
ncbi:MAG: VWA domain-containing protein [Anaerolineae bacterium]|nr:VWA domain-containing protein [Anaerolineae bacterium]